MSDDDIRRVDASRSEDDTPAEENEETPAERVSLSEALRNMAPLSKMAPADSRPYEPPPPLITRLDAVTQGCGALIITLMSVPMILVALGAGYYVWGPALFLGGGLVLLFSTAGLWGGKRTPLVVVAPVTVGLAILYFYWSVYIQAVVWLSPMQSLQLIYALASQVVVYVLLVALFMHVVAIFYWKRLKALSQRSLAAWALIVVTWIVLSFGFHYVHLQNREEWLTDHRDTWTAEAAPDAQITLGGNLNVTLGYTFLVLDDDQKSLDAAEDQFEDRVTESSAVQATGASLFRVGANGDVWLEQAEPQLFTTDEDAEPEEVEKEAAKREARLASQQAYEQQYVEQLQGVPLYLADAQYSPYLVYKANNDDEDIGWTEFVQLHEQRIRRYAEEYQPAAYEIVSEPDGYTDYSSLDVPEDDAARLDAWIIHTETLVEIVRKVSPQTLIGVSVALDNDFDMSYYQRVLELDGIDFIGLRVYQPEAFEKIEDLVAEYGHPADHGKQLWITETWRGYCLAPQRSMKLDSLWLEMTVAFAAKENISAVFPNDLGCYVQKGGTMLATDLDTNGRTQVWRTWRSLNGQWPAPVQPAAETGPAPETGELPNLWELIQSLGGDGD